jgi:hypothetical protein
MVELSARSAWKSEQLRQQRDTEAAGRCRKFVRNSTEDIIMRIFAVLLGESRIS